MTTPAQSLFDPLQMADIHSPLTDTDCIVYEHVWELDGKRYTVTLTLNWSKFGGIVAKAIGRHDGRTEIGAGAVVVSAKQINPKE